MEVEQKAEEELRGLKRNGRRGPYQLAANLSICLANYRKNLRLSYITASLDIKTCRVCCKMKLPI